MALYVICMIKRVDATVANYTLSGDEILSDTNLIVALQLQ